jgi:hypothetical protein
MEEPVRWRCDDCGREHVAGQRGNVYVDGGLWCRVCVHAVGSDPQCPSASGVGRMRKIVNYAPAMSFPPPDWPARTGVWPPPPIGAQPPPYDKPAAMMEVECAWCGQPKTVKASAERDRRGRGQAGPFHKQCLGPYHRARYERQVKRVSSLSGSPSTR